MVLPEQYVCLIIASLAVTTFLFENISEDTSDKNVR